LEKAEQVGDLGMDERGALTQDAVFEGVESGKKGGMHGAGGRRDRKKAIEEAEIAGGCVEAGSGNAPTDPRDKIEPQAVDGYQQQVHVNLAYGGRFR